MTARQRVLRLVEAARRIADPEDAIGRTARPRLVETTGLSPAGVEYALANCLETHPAEEELAAFCSSVPAAPRAHVVLSANVFTAALRAIALGLVASPKVFVRPSRREPCMAELLHEASDGLFALVDGIEAEPLDHVFAYGEDETLATIEASLPKGCLFSGHGTGLGVAVLASRGEPWPEQTVRGLARDVIAFDQRGCLSPRVAFVRGTGDALRALARLVADELTRLEVHVPRGRLADAERAAAVRYRDTMAYAGEVSCAGKGWIGVDVAGESLLVPPVGRNLHVMRFESLSLVVAPIAELVAAVGVSDPALHEEVADVLQGARLGAVGRMQQPLFDGPVDRRQSARWTGVR